jgi:hypothetical protein
VITVRYKLTATISPMDTGSILRSRSSIWHPWARNGSDSIKSRALIADPTGTIAYRFDKAKI